MRGQHARIAVTVTGEEIAPCTRGGLLVRIEFVVPVRKAALYRAVDQIARNHRFVATAADVYGTVPGGVPRRRFKADNVVERVVVVYEKRLSGFENRLHVLGVG